MLSGVHSKAKKYKTRMFKFASTHLEPALVAELTTALARKKSSTEEKFSESQDQKTDEHGNYLDKDGNYIIGVYQINRDDLPLTRDLKALFNMLTAVEEMTTRYSLRVLSVFAMPQNLLLFQKNYKVYMSTSSVLAHYLHDIKSFMIDKISALSTSLKINLFRLYRFCTTENLAKVAQIIIDKIVLLEKYKKEYEESKKKELEGKNEEAKVDPNKGFFVELAQNIDFYLGTIYGGRYDTLFKKEEDHKLDSKEEKKPSYYAEEAGDTDTVRHVKYFSNGILAIHRTLMAYQNFKHSTHLEKLNPNITYTLFLELKRAFVSLSNFDYRAIVAENAGPTAEKIKKQLWVLNGRFQECAGIIDQYECENNIKEGALLKYLAPLIKEYKGIVEKLQIKVDKEALDNVYQSFRMKKREEYLAQICSQLDSMEKFLGHQGDGIAITPRNRLIEIRDYVKKYEDDICMDRSHLKQYQNYLNEIIDWKPTQGVRTFFWRKIDSAAHSLRMTLHSEIMDVFVTRQMYLRKQKHLLEAKIPAKEQQGQLVVAASEPRRPAA